jgi:hypothetical protein
MKVPLVPEIPLVSVPSVRDDDRRARKSPCEVAHSRRGRACLNARVMWNCSGLTFFRSCSGLTFISGRVRSGVSWCELNETRGWQRRTAVAGPRVQHTIKTKHLERCLLWNAPTLSANMACQAFPTV